jgi:hypothetical protein
MFTIKIIEPSGLEIVKEVKSIMLRPASESASGARCVTYFEVGSEAKAVDIFEGDVYLMNENGKTVADYCLGHPINTNEVRCIGQ